MSDLLTDGVLKWISDISEVPLERLIAGMKGGGNGQVQSGAVAAPGGTRQASGGPAKAAPPHGAPAHSASPAGATAPAATAAPTKVDDPQTKFDKAVLKRELLTTIENEVTDRYAHLKTGVLDTINKEKQIIEKLKTAAPKGPGSLLAVMGEVLMGVAMVAFPELILVKVAAKGVETAEKAVEAGIKVKDVVEKVEAVKKIGAVGERENAKAEAEATKSEFAAKMAAMDALLNFADKASEMIDNGGKAFVAKAKATIAGWDPPPNFHEKYIARAQVDLDMVTEFLGQEMHVTKPGGTADDVKKVQTALSREISKWLKQQYVDERRTSKALDKYQSDIMWETTPNMFQRSQEEAVNFYLKKHPDKAQKLEHELTDEYTDEFVEKVLGEKD